MFDTELKKYQHNGVFSLIPSQSETLSKKCNAPHDKGGVYLIYKVVGKQELLIYIGSSGQKNSNGTLKVRQGGMKDRLINGYHPNQFGQLKRIKRQKAFPLQMENEGITELKIYWWVTYDSNFSDFPTDVETKLREKYLTKFHKLPDWHN
jgi:hypothetical protein